MRKYPLRHLSIRVPWHDSGWSGMVCSSPHLNGACVKLKRIAADKQDEQELPLAGRSLEELPPDEWPCCVDERATFMAPFALDTVKRHALATKSPKHYGHFRPTTQRLPAYAAGIVPFRWMMKENLEAYGEGFDLGVDLSREPELGYESAWVHEAENQKALLNGFASHLAAESSNCLFYAKHVPFVEGTGRILIGCGRVLEIGGLIEYDRAGEGMRGMVWERPIQHSIRPNGKDGFLMPYQELAKRAEEDPTLDLTPYIAHAPSEHWDEFSYGSELVTHDGCISALLSMEGALTRIQEDLGIPTEQPCAWIHDELVRLWKVRGPFPGLGAVLRAFGLTRGVFVGHALQERAGENVDPWPQVDAAFRDPAGTLPQELRSGIKELSGIWKKLPEERRTFLKLLSRFELTVEQAQSMYEVDARHKKGWAGLDSDFLKNPYRLYECSRHSEEGLPLQTVDRGVFPDDTVRRSHPLPEPSQCESNLDARRVRAFAIQALEDAALQGHTLLEAGGLGEAIRVLAKRPECPVTRDILVGTFEGSRAEIVPVEPTGAPAFQLTRYEEIRNVVRKNVEGRVNGPRHAVPCDWMELLGAKFGLMSGDPDEAKARKEKALALTELAQARFSVLAGPAGAGKTTVLGILCAQRQIRQEGLLLLAPTGKARVRMQQLAEGAGVSAQTIAQFLNRCGRYDGHTGRYFLNRERQKTTGFGTVIVDEASMLTEDMLGALLDALEGVKRLILVGDPAQLPPIGAGRPFVDIIAKLRPENYESIFPRVATGYAELTIERRQIGEDRPDLCLARWFSNTPPGPGDDEIFNAGDNEHDTLRFIQWDKPEDFQAKLMQVLADELKLENPEDQRGFNAALGSTTGEGYQYFNATRNGSVGSVQAAEAWQILSPLRGGPVGVGDVNRKIHERFRTGFMDLATKPWKRSIPKPMGAERIVYGDKVINLSNHGRDGWHADRREKVEGYLANGEIGVAVGQWDTGKNPRNLNIEFTSQAGLTYGFKSWDFTDEGNAALELAYALTIHKAQGSQFGLVILVLPEGHPILSRELIYTALTRHQQRVVIMHQGQRAQLREFAAQHRSETARRRTNLLAACAMVEVQHPKGTLDMQRNLIHRSSHGLAVQSKSELVILEALLSAGIRPHYELALTLGGQTRWPDFTIEDDISGRTIYWEHLGMLDRADYRKRWERKLAWYRTHGILPVEEAPHSSKVLVTTQDTPDCGLDMGRVKQLIAEVCGG